MSADGTNAKNSGPSGKGRFLMGLAKRYILYEFRLKALALLLALTLWFSMTYVGETRMGFLVPVYFDELDRNMVIRETDTKNVMITVSGPLSILKNVKVDDIRVSLDASRAKEGRDIFTVRKGDVLVPSGLKVEDARPDYVVAELDRLVEKHLRVVVKLDKKWVDTYEVASWYPRYAEVEGPRELLQTAASVETLPVNGRFTGQQEVLDIPLDAKSLEARKMAPIAVRVTLKRISGRDIGNNK